MGPHPRNLIEILEFFYNVGDIQTKIQGHSDRAGHITCEAYSYFSALERVEDAVRKIKFITRPSKI